MLSTVIKVTSAADSGPGTLRAAVAAANAATKPVEIDFHLKGGESAITLTSGQLELSNTAVPITIVGPGAAALAIDGNHASRAFLIDPNVRASFSGLTIRDGLGMPTDRHVGFSFGGGILNDGTATLTDVNLSGNDGGDNGGGLANFGNATLTDCTVNGNQAGSGGGLENIGGVMTLTGTTISANDAKGSTLENAGGHLTLTDCTVSGASSTVRLFNYGIQNRGNGDMTFVDSTIEGFRSGAFLSIYGTLTMTGCTISGNSGPRGALSLSGITTLTDCTISDNSANYPYATGGGVNNFGTALLSGCTITGNHAGNNGGGLANYGQMTLTGCTISGNTAGRYGGGLTDYGQTTLTGCTISGNTAGIQGGGLSLSGSATLTGCTISGNTAQSGGGGVNTYGSGIDSLVACTISGNTSPSNGSGLYVNRVMSPQVSLTDTIIAGNSGQDDIDGAADHVTGSSNLIGVGSPALINLNDGTNGNRVGTAANPINPRLAPLGDYGGPTQTMALLPGSPAIHAGVAVTGVTTDQRGFALDSPPDIGAFQSHAGPLVVDIAIDGLGSPSGHLSLRQAVNLADVTTGGATITFDRSAFARKSVITLTAGPLELSNATGPVTIVGPGLTKLAISGGGVDRVFQVDQDATASLSGLTITGGFTTGDGGGVLNLGSLALSGDAIVGNSAANGGGVANAGTAVILGSSIDGNVASGNGGGIFNTGTLALSLVDLSANRAGTDGGGLYNRGTAALVFCTVDDNAASSGGGVYADASGRPVMLIGTAVKRNKGGNIAGRVIQP